MKNSLIIAQGKAFSSLSKKINLGNGTTWPGHIALKLNSSFIKEVLLHNPELKIIYVIGTNGKTTTTSLIRHILEKSGKRVIQNISGANMLNGIASTILLNSSFSKKISADFLLFEIDESSFPLACKEVTPDLIVALNLFRDQLDRYGEVNSIAMGWHKALSTLPHTTQLILNADDPQIAYLGKKSKLDELYFGVNEKSLKKSGIDHSSDSTFCPNCGEKLTYTKTFYSHLGIWECSNCQLIHPTHTTTSATYYPLTGLYNKYNTHAAVLTCQFLEIPNEDIDAALRTFSPSFGRQEQLLIDGKQIQIILAKNPAGFDQALATVLEQKTKNIVFALNDNAADGTDISWIWDVDFETLIDLKISITLSGTRAAELALRLKYAGVPSFVVLPSIQEALERAIKATDKSLFILPTYTAMLEVRKELTGKKIL